MSIAYPVTLNALVYHSLAFQRGGVIDVDNSSQFYVYVAIGYKSSVADVLSQNVGLVAPYGRRAFQVNMTTQSLAITIAPTNTPFAYRGTIRNSQAQVRITEYRDPKAYLNSPTFDIVAADQVIIAGGLIEANQSGMYTRDQAGNEVFAMNLEDGLTWAGLSLDDGDIMIGRGSNYLLWDNSAGTLTINSGGEVKPIATDVQFTSGLNLTWSYGTVRLSNATNLAINAGTLSAFGNGVRYLTVDPAGSNPQSFGVYSFVDIPIDALVVAVVVAVSGSAMSVIVSLGATLISGAQIVTGSIVTGNLAATAIDGMLITGATIRTNAAAVPDVQINSGGVDILADANDHLAWKDTSGARVASLAGQFSSTGTTFNRLKIYVNELLNRARGLLQLAAASSSGTVLGVTLDASGSATNDKVELSHSSPTGNLVAIRVLRTMIEMCAGASGALLAGLVIGGRGGVSPRNSALVDVLGTITSDGFIGAVTGNVTGNLSGNVTGNVTGNLSGNVTGNVTGNLSGDVNGGTVNADQVNCDQLMVGSYGSQAFGEINAQGRIATGQFYYAAGHAGLTQSITLAKLTSGGANGRLDFTGGILTGVIDPT